MILPNPQRCPDDFYFQLTDDEVGVLRSQNVTAISTMARTNPLGFYREGAILCVDTRFRGFGHSQLDWESMFFK